MFLDKLFSPRHEAPPAALTSSDGGWNPLWTSLLSTTQTAAGISVTPTTAMQVNAVYACVRVLSQTLAQLPLHVYERQRDGSTRLASEHPLSFVLQREANPWQTAYEWRETMMGHLALRGNAFSIIVPGIHGAASELLPIHPDSVSRIVRLENGRLRYFIRNTNHTETPYSQDSIFHLRGLSFDGLTGVSPISAGRDQIALSKATESYGSRFFANSAQPNGLLVTDQTLTPEAIKKLRDNWQKEHGGLEGAHRTAMLSNGLKWQSIGISNVDSQFLEARKFSVTEIARLFRIPPHMIGDLERATFTNIEMQSLEFVKFTMLPWLRCWESRMDCDFLGSDQRYYVRFNFDGLLRGDSAARSAFYASGISNGWMTPNEARELEDMNPLPGGDELLASANMTTLAAVVAQANSPDESQMAENRQLEKEVRELRTQLLASETERQRLLGLIDEATSKAAATPIPGVN